MNISNDINFTGEFFVPGKSGERIELDHLERYRFACQYAKGKSILDIACGFGYSGPLFIDAGATTYEGVDINPQLVANANSIYGSGCIKYRNGDIISYDSDRQFDVISCFETIEHVADYCGALTNLHRLLKPDGVLLISSPNRIVTSPNAKKLSDKPSNPYHTQEFTIEELRFELGSIGFSVETGNIFGQRQQCLIKNKFLSTLHDRIFGDPCVTTSPKVSLIQKKTPRYFIAVAHKVG